MTNDPKKDGDGHSPQQKKTDGDGQEKPGLVIDVILPEEKPDDDRELGKKH